MASPAFADKDEAKGGGDEPRGQTVSGCSHQANDLGIKGQDRQRFVERCIARGGDKWGPAESLRDCRDKAERLGLKGEAKDDLIRRCREYRDDEVHGDPRLR
jgi:hypothetical protein